MISVGKTKKVELKIPKEELFTDREEIQEDICSYINEVKKQKEGNIVLYLWSNGGYGKTTLLKHIRDKNEDICKVYCDLEKTKNKIDILYNLKKRILADNPKFVFPLFNLALLKYGLYNSETARYSDNKKEKLKVGKYAFDLANDIESVAPGIIEVLGKISKFSKLISLYKDGKELVNSINTAIRENSSKQVNKKYLDGISKMNNEDDIENQIHVLFAEDMNNNLKAYNYKPQDNPIVIIIDTLEVLQNQTKLNDNFENLMWLIGEDGLIHLICDTVWIIAGRENIIETNEKEGIVSKELQVFNEHFCDELLKKYKITDEEICKTIYKVTKGNPTYINICAETYINNNGNVTIDDFLAYQGKLVKLYTKYLDINDKKAIRLMSIIDLFELEQLKQIYDDVMGEKAHLNINENCERIINSTLVMNDDKYCSLVRDVRKAIFEDKEFFDEEKIAYINAAFKRWINVHGYEDPETGEVEVDVSFYKDRLLYILDNRIINSNHFNNLIDILLEESKNNILNFDIVIFDEIMDKIIDIVNSNKYDVDKEKLSMLKAYQCNPILFPPTKINVFAKVKEIDEILQRGNLNSYDRVFTMNLLLCLRNYILACHQQKNPKEYSLNKYYSFIDLYLDNKDVDEVCQNYNYQTIQELDKKIFANLELADFYNGCAIEFIQSIFDFELNEHNEEFLYQLIDSYTNYVQSFHDGFIDAANGDYETIQLLEEGLFRSSEIDLFRVKNKFVQNIVKSTDDKEKLDRILKLALENVEISSKYYKDNSRTYVIPRLYVANIYLKQSKFIEAKKMYEECLKIMENIEEENIDKRIAEYKTKLLECEDGIKKM